MKIGFLGAGRMATTQTEIQQAFADYRNGRF